MLGNFEYCNPTKLYFGKKALNGLSGELEKYGKNVLLVYGGGSIKKNGIYDEVVKILSECGKTVREVSGVMPNPTYAKLLEGAKAAREFNADLILAVGGGSVCDYSKGVSVSAYCNEDVWEKYYERFEEPDCRIIPVGCVLTMVGTGSEMNGGSVITNTDKKMKVGQVFGENVFPKFAILDPEYTFTLPKYQMTAGFFDIMSHIMEQYFSGSDDNTSDYIMEGLMRSLIHSSRIAVADPLNYEARSNIMWTATWALNTLVAMGKEKMAPVVEKNKELKLGKVMNLGITMDERVADGFYFAKSLRLWKDMFANPDCLLESMPDDGSKKMTIKKRKKAKKSKVKKTKVKKDKAVITLKKQQIKEEKEKLKE